jgi:hypothetical protein
MCAERGTSWRRHSRRSEWTRQGSLGESTDMTHAYKDHRDRKEGGVMLPTRLCRLVRGQGAY